MVEFKVGDVLMYKNPNSASIYREIIIDRSLDSLGNETHSVKVLDSDHQGEIGRISVFDIKTQHREMIIDYIFYIRKQFNDDLKELLK